MSTLYGIRCIIAGIPPLDLFAIERKLVFEVKSQLKDDNQKELWDSASKEWLKR